MSRTRRSASERSGHGASVFTGDLRVFQYQDCELAALLRHVAGSPGLGLLRGLRPVRVPTVDSGPARHRPWLPAGRAAPVRFPRSPHTRSTGEVPSFAPAASPRVRRSPTPWPPSRRLPPVPESPAKRGCALPPDPCPPGWGSVRSLKRLWHWFTCVTPSCLACRTRAVWRCQPVPALSGLLPPGPALPGPGCPQLLLGCCDSPAVEPFHLHPVVRRIVAHAVIYEGAPLVKTAAPVGRHD